MSLRSTFTSASIRGWSSANAPVGSNIVKLIPQTTPFSTVNGFAQAIAISGDGSYISMGSPSSNIPANPAFSGVNSIYGAGATWPLQQIISSSPPPALVQLFGSSSAFNSAGNYLVVGGPTTFNGTPGILPTVYIFTRSGSTWTQQAAINGIDTVYDDLFGISCAINDAGNILVVGATGVNAGLGNQDGAVYIFKRIGSTWTQSQKITGTIINGQLGESVSINSAGNYIVIGANLASRAYVYFDSGSGTYALQSTLNSLATSFGTSVDIDSAGSKIIVGAPTASVGGSNNGAVYYYTRSGTTWTQQGAAIISNTPGTNYQYGSSVALSGDGTTFIVGSYRETLQPFTTNAGAAYVYLTSNATTAGIVRKFLSPSGPSINGNFGYKVAISDDASVYGITQLDNFSPNDLAAFIYF
jgi:hypothetical protein